MNYKLHSMRPAHLLACIALFIGGYSPTNAQVQPENEPELTEQSEVVPDAPVMDDFTERHIVSERKPLAYAPVREADILWEKRLWRVIDVREKRNLAFTYPVDPFFQILADAAESGKITVYGTDDDKFTRPMRKQEVTDILHTRDTVWVESVEDPANQPVAGLQVVYNSINWENVKRFRIKEAWWFDTNTGSLRHRILGIAPMLDMYDDEGNFKYETPLFWVHYPSVRPLLAQHRVMISGDNMATTLSWEDLFEQRRFASYIMKESNMQDRRLQDYLEGPERLMASQQIQDDLFNREHDLWQQ